MRTVVCCLFQNKLENVRWKLEEVFQKKIKWIIIYCMVKPWNSLLQDKQK